MSFMCLLYVFAITVALSATGVSVRTHRQTSEAGAVVTAMTVTHCVPRAAQDPVERLKGNPAGVPSRRKKRARESSLALVRPDTAVPARHRRSSLSGCCDAATRAPGPRVVCPHARQKSSQLDDRRWPEAA
jgi:hypothetical protein